jgi:putative glutamine amidotransferase
MARPLIAVTAARELLPTAFGDVDCTRLTSAYTDAVYDAGGQPVILPVAVNPPPSLLERMDGLLLSGGGDLDPVLYGEQPDPKVYGIRRDRDSFEAAVYRQAVDLRIPILAICRGMQLVNVLRGGTLRQHVDGHWQENPPTNAFHPVSIEPGSALADVVGSESVIDVNSYHHQALNAVGAGLRVTAVCGDVIEAVEAEDAELIAVQWHPEQMGTTAHQRALFERFVTSAATTRTIA